MGLKAEILRYSRQEHMKPLDEWFDASLEKLIDLEVYPDLNNLEDIGQKLTRELSSYKKTSRLETVALGMSGGVDSALTAALFKAAGWNVLGLTMPIHQKPEETERGIEACKALGIEHKHVDLTKTFDSLLKSFSQHDAKITSESEAIRRGNLRVRLRMMTVYNEASARKGIVGATDNFSELAAGFWTLHGDVGDLAPIQSLLKSWEVPKLAELYGVPESTVFATPTDGLGISAGDEDQFGFSYLELDIVLGLLSLRAEWDLDRAQLIESLGVTAASIDRVNSILDRIKRSAFKRINPFNLKHPMQSNRYSSLANADQILWWNKNND